MFFPHHIFLLLSPTMKRSISDLQVVEEQQAPKKPRTHQQTPRGTIFSAQQELQLQTWVEANSGCLLPTCEQRSALARQTSLSLDRVKYWFSRCRARIRRQLKRSKGGQEPNKSATDPPISNANPPQPQPPTRLVPRVSDSFLAQAATSAPVPFPNPLREGAGNLMLLSQLDSLEEGTSIVCAKNEETFPPSTTFMFKELDFGCQPPPWSSLDSGLDEAMYFD